ncbi:MAG: glycosyltransferase family 2 protein [Phycisphaerae bacterium]|jgi:chlorobactene glucosyltransferase|nr:glycosyltransferase family 2 protein [Phycisphaerae bacterium]
MVVSCVVLTVFSVLVAMVWISRHVMIYQQQRSGRMLGPDSPGPGDDPPLVSVMVAAKDEEACIERCVRSMLGQDYPNFEMIVCNDRSDDNTAAIVQRIADEDPRLRLVNIESLPEGWCGKNNAMQTGIAQSTGEWICMIDADCRQTSNRTLSVAVQHARDNDIDLFSILPALEMNGFWEKVIQPVCSGVMMIWFSPDKVNNPAKPNAYANGAFMLMRREVYEAIGTHEAVKDQVNEDMHMADRIKKSGKKLRVLRSDGLYTVRMYTSFKQIIRGWSRIFFGTFGTLKRLTISFLLMAVMGLLPYAAALVGLLGFHSTGSTSALVCGIAGLAGVAMQLSVIFRYYRLLGNAGALALTYSMACIITLVVIIISMTKLRAGATVTWKSTTYSKTKT